MPLIVLPGGGDVEIVKQKTLREKLSIDVMALLKVSVLKAQGRQDCAGMELTARASPTVWCCAASDGCHSVRAGWRRARRRGR